MYYVYILKCNDNSLYTGITVNIKKRLEVHNQGKASKYTRARLPVKCVYTEESKDRSTASKRECEIKKLTRANKLKLIKSNKNKIINLDLE